MDGRRAQINAVALQEEQQAATVDLRHGAYRPRSAPNFIVRMRIIFWADLQHAVCSLHELSMKTVRLEAGLGGSLLGSCE